MSIYASLPGIDSGEDPDSPGPPRIYRGSHILPAEDDPRDGSIGLALIPSHITRDGRDDQPEDGTPYPWLRLSIDVDDGHAAAVIDPAQARYLAEQLTAWADQVDPPEFAGGQHWWIHAEASRVSDRIPLDNLTSDALDALYDDRDRADKSARRALEQRQEMAEERYIWQQRGDRAEAALARVRALAEEWRKSGKEPNAWIFMGDAATAVVALLDEPGPATAQATDSTTARTARIRSLTLPAPGRQLDPHVSRRLPGILHLGHRPTSLDMMLIAEAADVSVDWLLYGDTGTPRTADAYTGPAPTDPDWNSPEDAEYDTAPAEPDRLAQTGVPGWMRNGVRDPCPRCEDCPLIPRALMADHMREHHPEEQQ